MDAVVLTFTEWMLRVDLELMRKAAVSHHDLPEFDYRSVFEAGRSAEEVAGTVLAGSDSPDDAERMVKAKAADERITEQLAADQPAPEHGEPPQTPATKRRGRQPARNRRTGNSGESEGG